MLNRKQLEQKIVEDFEHDLTEDQYSLVVKLSNFITGDNPDLLFLLKGYAGTGKTTVISSLIRVLGSIKQNVVLLAPTGRAAKVLTRYSGKTALTIHKLIYRQKQTADDQSKFDINFNKYENTIFIVDESSMISNQNSGGDFGSGYLLDDLIQFVDSRKGCRLIFIGDTAQLPPVGSNLSVALDGDYLHGYGKEVVEHELTDVVRQTKESGILNNATLLRNLCKDQFYSDGYFKFDIKGFPDVERVSGEYLIDKLSESYDKEGVNETLVVTRSNKRANLFNKGVRGSVLYKDTTIDRGDLLMVVKNNYFWGAENTKFDFIANGEIAEVVYVGRAEELYGFKFLNITLLFVDYDNLEIDCKVIIETLDIETPSLSRERSQELFYSVAEDYADIRNKKERWKKVKENPYFNALQVKFAYAVTCHKSQGGQWKNLFLDQGYVTEEMIDVDYIRWLYTGVTRASKKLYLVNFKDDFFE